jgi:hypothetical protein
MEKDEALNPVGISFFGAETKMTEASDGAHLIQ